MDGLGSASPPVAPTATTGKGDTLYLATYLLVQASRAFAGSHDVYQQFTE